MGFGIATFLYENMPLFIYMLCILVCIRVLAGDRLSGYYFMLVILPFTYTLEKVQKYPLGNQVLDVLLICLTIATLIYQKNKIRSYNSIPILLHIIMTIFSFLYGYLSSAPLPMGAFGDEFRSELLKNYLTMPLMYWITLGIMHDYDANRHKKWIVYLLMIILIVVVWRFWNGFRFRSSGSFSYDIRSGAFGSLGANHLAAFLVEYMAVAIGVFLFDINKKIRILSVAAFCAGVYGVLFCYSRAAYVALPTIILFLFSFKKKYLITLLIVVFLAGGAITTIFPKSVMERITMTRTSEGEIESSANTRLLLWQEGKEIFFSNPVFGIGYQMVPKYVNIDGLRNLHNYLLQVLVESGIIGFLIFLYFLISAFRCGWRLFRLSPDPHSTGLGIGFCGCVIASVITNFFGDRWSFPEMQTYWWIIWAICDSMLMICREKTQLICNKK